MSETASPESQAALASPEYFDPRTTEVLDLAIRLTSIPGVSIPDSKLDLPRINQTLDIARGYATQHGLSVVEMPADEEHPFPYLMVSFNQEESSTIGRSKIALVGHIDVVGAQDSAQFEPKIEGDMLIGRGAADMKTVVATQLVWMAEQQMQPGPKPPVVLMISCTEENGSTKPNGTQHAIAHLRDEFGVEIELAIVGERTGEMESMGKPKVGPICDANRGWRWYRSEGDGSINGSAAFDDIAYYVNDARVTARDANKNIGSPRTEAQKNWRTGLVNSFVQIGADPELAELPNYTVIRITKVGEAKHAAAITPDQSTLIEEFDDIYDDARTAFKGDNVKIEGVNIGQDGNFNTVTGGGEMRLVVIDSDTEAFIEALKAKGYQVETQEVDSSSRPASIAKPVFGFDVREIPEHTSEINIWIDETRASLAAIGFDFVAVNEGDGWVCPEENDHLARLRAAYEEVIGSPSPALGKLHGNDGRFFEGKAIVFGQTGISPHGPKEAHYIPSILPYLQILDRFAASYAAA